MAMLELTIMMYRVSYGAGWGFRLVFGVVRWSGELDGALADDDAESFELWGAEFARTGAGLAETNINRLTRPQYQALFTKCVIKVIPNTLTYALDNFA